MTPLKEVRIKQQSDPWVNSELLELIKQRDHNLKLFRKSKLNEDYKNYLHFRNQVDYTTKCAKSMYFNPRKPYATPVTRNLNRPCCLAHSPI